LGLLPIANELWLDIDYEEEVFPLHLRICRNCGLGQVEDVVSPERLFSDYRYLSSTSSLFSEHAKLFVQSVLKSGLIKEGDWVLEIASNDGYLLKHFVESKISVLGIEPAENISLVSESLGIPTLNTFFSSQTSKQILEERGYPKLIIANNVLAHVPDIQDFLLGIATLCGDETQISIENPSLLNILHLNQFDTIYHEHYSYLSVNSVHRLSSNFGLELFDVKEINTHGGSNRYWLRRQKEVREIPRVIEGLIQSELGQGLLSQPHWDQCAQNVEKILIELNEWLSSCSRDGRKVCGYGAAAKASTLLNAAKIERGRLEFIADGSIEKQGRRMPIKGFPIVSPIEMLESNPTDVLIFPWNISSEIASLIREVSPKSIRIWQAVPNLREIE
jgi:2-polyprenyl-3-methyl-5-hydroxy-6-metoxy-1,4-benzoquinol methylase